MLLAELSIGTEKKTTLYGVADSFVPITLPYVRCASGDVLADDEHGFARPRGVIVGTHL